MKIKSIHQFSFACSSGSGVTNSLFYVQKILQKLGFNSEIFSNAVPADLTEGIHDVSTLVPDSDSLLLLHFCMGYDGADAILNLPMPKLMVYHNITPPEFLPEGSEIQRYAVLGRNQLRDWPSQFIGAIGDSPLNGEELVANGYTNIDEIPLLVDLEKLNEISPETREWQSLKGAYNILFVGRICENKGQLELVDALHHLKHMTTTPVNLILAGEVTSGTYLDQIRRCVADFGLDARVLLTGKISDQSLAGLYRSVDAFVCLSKHEGFGMPLIEAMHFKLPVIARDSSNIARTLGGTGRLLAAHENSRDCATAIFSLMRDTVARRQIVATQSAFLARFSASEISERLERYLTTLDIEMPARSTHETMSDTKQRWQIEGPFDSSYSLAIVNRELARALDQRGVDIGLRSREGHGDFLTSPDFLNANPDCQRMAEKSKSGAGKLIPRVALRFCFPPYLDDMPANIKLVHSYGWEETGFPQIYVDEFNQKLDMVSVLSDSVGRHLRNSGVRVPIVATGAGVDHLLHIEASPLPLSLSETLRKFRFLHISSCFPRKGVDVLLRAFEAAFDHDDAVSLVIKTFTNPHNTVAHDVEEMRKNNPRFPHVLVIEEDWSQEQILGLYQASHALVAPSRGEGFGLPMAEAMLFNLPVITTNWGGQTDFCDNTTAWCCDYVFAKAQTHMGLTNSLWAEPDETHLSELMRAIVLQSDTEKRQRTEKARAQVLARFTWAKTAENMQSAVAALETQKHAPKKDGIAWISTWNARCGIANYSHFLTENMPQERLTVLANHIPERMGLDRENVIRCWTAKQEETFEYALELILERDIRSLVIQYNFGFCSTENLAEFIHQLSVNDIAMHLFIHSTADVIVEGKCISLSNIKSALAQVTRIYVHGVDDINRFKTWGVIDNVVCFPHGIAARSLSNHAAKRSLHDKKVIASYGFLLPHKGIQQLIKAFAQMRQAGQDLHLLLVNALYPASISDDEERACRDLIRELRIEGHVSLFTEFLSDSQTHEILCGADVIVFPYQQTQESSSAAVRVGLSTGRPVLVTPLAIFDDVADAVHRLPGTSASDIEQGLTSFFTNPAAITQKQASLDLWFAERSWPLLASRLLNIIDGLNQPLDDYKYNC